MTRFSSRAVFAASCIVAWAGVPASIATAQPGVPTIPEGPEAVVIPQLHAQSVVMLLQHTPTSVQELIDSEAGWKSVEPTVNGRPSGDLSPAEVAAMRSRPDEPCTSVVMAYLSVGSAENTRGYWRDEWLDPLGRPVPGVAPGWLGPANLEMEGRYSVRYWHRGWKDLLFGTPAGPNRSAVDRVIDQGFDGVYLDAVDAYSFWSSIRPEVSRRVARERMVRLVEQVATYARVTRGVSGFRVVARNAHDIVLDDLGQPDDLRDRYGAVIDGIGLDNLFFDGTRRLAPEESERRLEGVSHVFENRLYPAAIGFGPRLFAVDFVLRGANLNSAANRARATSFLELCGARGIVGYAARADRVLDEVVVLGGPRWTVRQPETGCGLLCPVCLAGLDLAGNVASGLTTGDGVVDEVDAAFFFAAVARGDLAADIAGSPGPAGAVAPDGVVDARDVAYFVEWYARR